MTDADDPLDAETILRPEGFEGADRWAPAASVSPADPSAAGPESLITGVPDAFAAPSVTPSTPDPWGPSPTDPTVAIDPTAAYGAAPAGAGPSPAETASGYGTDMFASTGTPQSAQLGYAVDLVFVIDITGSMTPVIESVKAGARTFHDRLLQVMGAKDKYVSSLRLRVVAYRDYLDNAVDGLFHTPFFRLPDEQHHFDAYVGGLHADGGGDEPESGLEALAVACLSDWERGLDRRRHVVVLFTDASAHPLEAASARAIAGYPTGLPRTFDELTDMWDDPQGAVMEFAAKRLLLYAPDVYPWNVISASWDNVLHFPSKAGAGLNEVQFSQIVDAIAGSV